MGEVKMELEKLAPNRSAKWIPIGGLALAASLAVALGALWLSPRAPERGRPQTVKFTITPPTLGRGADNEIDTEVSISPNGEHITYVDSPRGQLWVRDLNQESARMVPGATQVYQVFWSPDSKHVGYSTGMRELMRIPLEGGVATKIVTLAGDFRRASWSADGKTILYADTTGLHRVPAWGGTPVRLVQHPHIEHPSWLNMPDGRRAILYQAVDETPNRHGIYVRMPGEAEHHRLLLTNSGNPYPAYSPTGHIIYTDGDIESSAIWALPFSINELRATGKPFRVAQAGSSPQVSATGTLVYSDVPSARLQLTMHERGDGASRLLGPPQLRGWLALSPDGRRLAVLGRTPDPDIWIYDTAQGTATQFTSDKARESPASWSPDGNELVYSSNRPGTSDVYAKRLAAGADPRALVSTPEVKEAPRWSPDGRFLLYDSVSLKTRRDLVFRERSADGRLGDPVVFVSTPADETLAQFSPDGRYVAYSSNETGNFQIFISDFPRAARKWKISDTSGFMARWVKSGRELVYNDRTRIYAVPVSTEGDFTFGKAEIVLHRKSSELVFEVSGDGQRIYTWDRLPNQAPVAVHIVHHWFEEFRQR
jgi:Tol biopolymer transport system component